MSHKMYSSMSYDSAKFYHTIITRVGFNAYAVRTGLFPVLFCESNDPKVLIKWGQALPIIIDIMERRQPNLKIIK